ncbi:MAG: hypothetical protein V4631_18165 [Pseudomonadota bacterium]
MLGLLKNVFAGSASREQDEAALRQALSGKTAAIISASCCSAGAGAQDEVLHARVKAMLDEKGLDWPIVVVTITQAQSALGKVAATVGEVERGLCQEIQGLFMNHGLAVFPALIVDQKLICYGGVPSVEQLQTRLDQLDILQAI